MNPFGGSGVSTQVCALARQVLYHLSPFGSGYFKDRVSLFVQEGLDHDPILYFPQ
jgi:hypothetical protein